MNNFIKRALGIVYAEEKNGVVTLQGVRTRQVASDMMRIWSTNKVERFMFNEFSGRTISFNSWFAPEVHYMLQQILHTKGAATSRGAIRAALRSLEEDTWLAGLTKETEDILDKSQLKLFKKTPLPHQMEFFGIYNRRVPQFRLRGYLLSAGAGTGKTLMDLMLAEMLHASVVFIVSPNNAVYKVWDRTLKEEYHEPQQAWIVADGKPYNGEKYIITHYEGLEKARAVIGKVDKRKAVVVLDESHNLNNEESLRTQLFVQCCLDLKAENVIWASGTPIKALGGESIPILRTIDPLFTADVEKRFKAIFGRSSSRALDILRNRMGIISFRVEKDDVRTNPEPVSHTINVKIPNGKEYTLEALRADMKTFVNDRLKKYMKNMGHYEDFYDDVLDDFKRTLKTKEELNEFNTYKTYIKVIRRGYDPKLHIAEAKFCNIYEVKKILPTLSQSTRNEFKSVRSIIKYPKLKVVGEALGGILGRKRVQCHLDMIPYIGMPDIINKSEKKTIIFSSYVEVVDAASAYLAKNGIKNLVVHGFAGESITSQVTKFDKDDSVQALVATYQSLSTAVPLIMANSTIFINSPFRDFEMTQAKARTDRLGQDATPHFYHAYLDTGKEPNISTRSKDILEWSKAQVSAILGDEAGKNVLGLDDLGVSLEEHREEIYQLALEDMFLEHY